MFKLFQTPQRLHYLTNNHVGLTCELTIQNLFNTPWRGSLEKAKSFVQKSRTKSVLFAILFILRDYTGDSAN